MTTSNRTISADELDGVKGYSPMGLRIYDALVYGVTSPYFWKVSGRDLLAHYNRYISTNHMDVGVGTGYLLDKCTIPGPLQRLYLFDLSPNSLATTAKRLARYRPTTIQGSVLDPIPYEGEPFDSIGTNYMIHCVPGSIPEKEVLFDHLAVHLRPGGVIFGSTVLGQNIDLPLPGRFVFDSANKKGVFHNRLDNEDDLRKALEKRFASVNFRRVGNVALFAAYKK